MTAKTKSTGAMDFRLIRRIVGLSRPHKKLFWLSIFLTLGLIILAPIRPLLVKNALESPIPDGDLSALTNITLLILAHIIVQSLVMYFHTYTINLLAQNVIKDLRMTVFNHILKLRASFFDRSKVGMLVTRSVSDVETVAQFFSQGLISIIGDVAQLLFILILMFVLSWKLTLLSLAVLPILLIASEYFRRGVRSSFQEVRTQVSALNSYIQEQITGMQVVQLFGKKEQSYEKFESINRKHLQGWKNSIFYYAVYFPIVEILSSLALGLIIWYAVRPESNISAGLITAFIMFVSMIFRPIRTIADRFNTMQMGMVSSERIFALIDDKKPIEQMGDVTKPIDGRIVFEDVWFAYNPNEHVIKGISFELKRGQSLAIVGATGAGKSSIVSLITRNYDIQKGSIKIDDIDIKDYNLPHLRNEISVVLQDVFLFAGSIADNVSLNDPTISKKDMLEAARSIGALELIESLPDGWNYNVMERGGALSVGQRQLISFIRAIAAKPKVLILDEATSSVDSETEELLQKATDHLMRNRTSIAIAHRLSTVKAADTILVLDKGQIVERGNHDELIEKGGAYYELFKKQFELV